MTATSSSTPVYESGPVLEDGATLDTDRTGIPLELDEIYQSLDDIAVALGPDGANKDGALTRLLQSTAENFGGQGEQFNETIRNLSRFTSTLDNNKDALFDTAREVERFVGALEENDQTVRDFNDSLAAASSVLEGERDDLAAALRNLGIATEQVSSFVKENEQALSENIKGLVRLTDILVRQRERARRDAERGADRPVEPVPHLQPADRHAGHPDEPRARTSARHRDRPARDLVLADRPGRGQRGASATSSRRARAARRPGTVGVGGADRQRRGRHRARRHLARRDPGGAAMTRPDCRPVAVRRGSRLSP